MIERSVQTNFAARSSRIREWPAGTESVKLEKDFELGGVRHFFGENALTTSKAVKSSRFRLLVVLAMLAACSPARGDAIDRLKPAYLKSLHEAIEAFRHDRQPVSLPSPFIDYRAAIHVHSGLSHDSRGTVAEIIKAAKQVGVKVILFTEHPAPPRDYFKEGHRGMVEGVLMIPRRNIKAF